MGIETDDGNTHHIHVISQDCLFKFLMLKYSLILFDFSKVFKFRFHSYFSCVSLRAF